jgi:2-oxoglutarate ferredoxin oxidoreductase subunit alpha
MIITRLRDARPNPPVAPRAILRIMQEITLSIVGSGGDGAVVAGDILAMACAASGLHVMKTEAYGPQIRGGESSCTVRIGAAPITAQADRIEALVVLSWDDFARFRDELVLAEDATIFYDATDAPPEEVKQTKIAVPFEKLPKNMVSLGILCSMYGLPADAVRSALRRRFGKKSAAVIEANLEAFDRGIAFTQTLAKKPLAYTPSSPRLLMSGNEATAFGAIHAGCSFFAGYPITPSSEVLHLMAEWLPRLGGSSLQTEDELSAIGAVIGASFAGAKSMTATSGPGLSLMSEMLGLSSIGEVPAVIVNVQRGGPSTGIPTKSEQSDLFHSVFASHGDTPRVVIAPCDVEDSFHATVDAFNIAEEYQVPVIVLSDQLIAQRRETIDAASLTHDVRGRRVAEVKDEEYRRYAITEDGVSPMSIPGQEGGTYQTNGLEHDERGRPNAMFITHQTMNEKRYRKMAAIGERYRLFRRAGASKPRLGILCWGSSFGVVKEAVMYDRDVAIFAPRILAPLPAADIQAFVDSCEDILIVELSYGAQFHQYLRTQIDLPRGRTHLLSRSGGKNLGPSEIQSKVASLQEVVA